MINSPEGPDKRESAEKPTVFPRILVLVFHSKNT